MPRRVMLLVSVFYFSGTIAIIQFLLNYATFYPVHVKLEEHNVAQQAYVTLLTRDSYAPGVVALGRSIQEMQKSRNSLPRHMVCMITKDVSQAARNKIKEEGWRVHEVSSTESPDRSERFQEMFSKVHLWNMTSYEKVLYLDADSLVVNPVDELFTCSNLCFVPNENVKRLDIFNSGTLVLKPSRDMFELLMAELKNLTYPSWNNEDQDQLNAIFYWYCKGSLQPKPTEAPNNSNNNRENNDSIDKKTIASSTGALFQAIEPEQQTAFHRPSRLFSEIFTLSHHRKPICQALPLAYNYRVNAHEWSFYQPYMITTPINILQYTGSEKPWECAENEKYLTLEGWLLCYSKFGQTFTQVMRNKHSFLHSFSAYPVTNSQY